ncbi:heat-inducible transcription repressor HrcA [Acetomicrobium thermoterrenum DSM 13490]|uniref:Heat-inducible transcription repressor HrcA n=1 Tax=Acetomicrobium thermoterrenum DSM 13490 TaxID=1120987 RepID=A0A1H3GU78_9BACT|nr:heat-inducible transcriptional repressor HrcA [Acetomicrobium thermoterrenum]SDY06883.1 heat-inducible transcription repressor HrcA [Acetomicrobium thermoterrenum DSM 13490]
MLTERQLEILYSVVHEYIRTGESVGSRTISKKYLTNRSAATIRNEMADLEEAGFLHQPYTSAGRVPTSKAYRVYVDMILQRDSLQVPATAREKLSSLKEEKRSIENMLSYLTQLLGSITHYISLAGITVLNDATLSRLDLVKVDSHYVLLVIILEGGLVHHDIIRTERDVSQEELNDLTSYLNGVIAGRTWLEARDLIRERVFRELVHYAEICMQTLDEVDYVLKKSRYRFFTGGTSNILLLPDFRDTEKLRSLLVLLENEEEFAKIVDACATDEPISVIIGDENPVNAMKDCSLVLASAESGVKRTIIGVIGPVRMDYEGTIGVLELLCEQLLN